MRKPATFLIMILLFFLACLKVDPAFESVDKRIYTYYSISLAENHDFNVVRLLPAKETWLLTPTLNYPDVHSNGSSVLWSPFFWMAHHWALGTEHLKTEPRMYRALQALVNVFYGLLCVPLLWVLLRNYFPASISMKTILIIFSCTIFYWYWLFQPENADITAFFVSLIILNFFTFRKSISPLSFSFLFGLGVSAGVSVKFDLIFHGLLFAYFLLENRQLGWANSVKNALAFSTGFLIICVAILWNETLKNGFLNYSYFDTVESHVYSLGEILLSPSGYFITHPFYAVLIGLFLYLSFQMRHNKLPTEFLFYLAVPLSKLILEGFNYGPNETLGPRHWIDDTGCFAVALGYVTSRVSTASRVSRLAFFGACGASALISVLSALVYQKSYETYFYTGNWLLFFKDYHLSDLRFIYQLPWLNEKLSLFPIILLMAGLTYGFYFWVFNRWTLRIPAVVIALLVFGYWGATLANANHNKLSASEIPISIFERAVIGKGHHINSFFENAGCLLKSARYYQKRGKTEEEEKMRRLLFDYVQKAKVEIEKDPMHFKEKLKRVTASDFPEEVLPKELWDDEQI